MSSEKTRLVTFFIVTFLSILVIQRAMEFFGLAPVPKKPDPAAVAQAEAEPGKGEDEAKGKAKEPAKEKPEPGKPAEAPVVKAPEPKKPTVAMVNPGDLILGSATDKTAGGYLLEVQLEQTGAGVALVASSKYEAEYEQNKPKQRRPLHILAFDEAAPPSLAITLRDPKRMPSAPPEGEIADPEAEAAARIAASGAEVALDAIPWEVVREGDAKPVRAVSKKAANGTVVDGQEASFRTKVDAWGVTVTKTFRLWKGEEGFEVDFAIESPENARSVVYKVLGPHGLPIEGEWFTGTFRDAIFGLANGSKVKVQTLSAYEIAQNKTKPVRFQSSEPLKFAGVENQYFVSFIEPLTAPATADERYDAEAVPILLHEVEANKSKSDIGIEIVSRPVTVGPNAPMKHSYRVYAGPKSADSLRPFGAEEVAAYRKSNWIPFAPDIARWIITPLLDTTYGLTKWVASLFGGTKGNYGVAIILLTMVVRLAMFPLGRKQAVAAKKMQDLQPYMKEIAEKYKDDPEAKNKETWALYKRHGVNPVAGCLPALIQMPIFVGLWQALNNSVYLRHASFLYIDNLAAPDMAIRLPFKLAANLGFFSFDLGWYINILPFVVVSLMLVQTKLFSPPPTTPEAEMQQKTMKFMMIFMAFVFYKVPSGLGLYFITSSLWQISERLLLPKVTGTSAAATTSAGDGKTPPPGGNNNNGGGGGGGGGRGPNALPPKPPGRFAQFWEKVLAEAQKNPTYRNLSDEKDKDKGRPNGRDPRDGGRDRDRGKPRAKPGRRR